MSSTPLAPAVGALDQRARATLTREVIARWQPFVDDEGMLVMELDVLLVTAR